LSTEPLVSIVIPVLNGERHIEECMASVLGQTYQNIEVVVSENSSIDRTDAIIRSFNDPRVRILAKPAEQLDLHANWARGLAAAKGEFVKIVCHDDLLLPDCLAVQTELLLMHPASVMAGGRRRIIDDQGSVLIKARGLGRLTKPGGTRVVDGGTLAHACTRAGANLLGEPANMLIRRSALPEPLFDPRWHYTIDVEFYMRCLQHNDAVLDNRILCCFRVSHHQWSAALATDQARELRAFFLELERRYPNQVSSADVQLGTARAWFLAQARKALYQQMRLRTIITPKRRLQESSTEHALLGISDVSPEHK
jgi:glycosyltransferase involved in cell wall biosynthesis